MNNSIDQQIITDAAQGEEVAQNLFALCDKIGPRFAGTDGYRRAAEFMVGKFRDYQLTNPRLEPFAFTAWRRGAPASLTMTEPLRREFPCYALPYGAATGPAGVRAPLIDMGGGSVEELDALRQTIPGCLVLTNSASGHRNEIYARCVAAGAVGFLLSNRVPGMLLHSGSVGDGEGGSIPAVSIGLEAGLQIQRLVRTGAAHFHLVTDGRCEPATSWNVVGELLGQERSEEFVIMGGHLDSHEIGPGAYDNGAGTVAVMEVARLLAPQRRYLKRTIRFIGFGAEEVGLLGSHHYARSHADELRHARWMLNCDVPPLAGPHGLAFHNCPHADSDVARLSEQMGMEIACHHRNQRHSDHYPFGLQGVTTSAITGGREGSPVQRFMHMTGDTPEKIPIEGLRNTAVFAARVLFRVATGDFFG